MTKKSVKMNFFLFNIVRSDSGLKKDEVTLISRIAYSMVAILLLVDLVAVAFYIKTNKRLNFVINHEYTQDISKNLKEARLKHEEYAQRSKKIIMDKQNYLKNIIKRLEFDKKQAKRLKTSKVELASLENLIESIGMLYNNNNRETNVLQQAILNYDDTENELIRLNDYLMPLTEVDRYNMQLETYLENLFDDLNNSQKAFINQIYHFSDTKMQQQEDLKSDILKITKTFDEYYRSMVQRNKFKKINNFYKSKFLNFDYDFIPYSTQFSNKLFGTQLTESTDFMLILPRFYICNLQAIIRSDYNFEVNFEYIDKRPTGEEIKLFETEYMSGQYKNPIAYNNFQMFDLDKGYHNLYLRTVSKGLASNVHIGNLKFECLSYRKFRID